ncbi:MAG: cell division FtsA domain-containing protein [Patescibacteria group bacterium]
MALFTKRVQHKRRGEFYIVLDLGTENIKCLVVQNSDHQSHILGKGQVPHRLGTMRGGMVINIPEAGADVKQAIAMATTQAGVTPKKLVMSLSGDLVKSLVTTVHYHRTRPESHINANELKNVVYKAQWKAFEQIRSMIGKDQEESSPGVKLINTTIVDTRIDGYKVANPINFQGGVVTLSIFNAFAPLVHLGANQAIADELGMDLLSVVAAPYALAKSLLVDNPEFSAVFVDVGAYLTDVAVVNEGGIMGMQNFALGGQAFTRSLAAKLKVPPEQAEQIKLDYSQGLLDKRSEKKISGLLKEPAKLWAQGLAESLDEFSHLDVLPNKIFIAGGGAALPEIKSVLLSKSWAAQLPFIKKPYPVVIEPTDIAHMVEENQVTIDVGDTVALGLAHLTLNLANQDDTMGDILRRIVLNMQA